MSAEIKPDIKALELAEILSGNIHILYVNDAGAGYRYPSYGED